jgi:hypothetical protein
VATKTRRPQYAAQLFEEMSVRLCYILLFGMPVRIVVCRFIGVLYMRNEGKN